MKSADTDRRYCLVPPLFKIPDEKDEDGNEVRWKCPECLEDYQPRTVLHPAGVLT